MAGLHYLPSFGRGESTDPAKEAMEDLAGVFRGDSTVRSGAGDLFSGDNLRCSDPSPSKDPFFDAVLKPVYDGGFFNDMVGMRNPSLVVQDGIFGLSSALSETFRSSAAEMVATREYVYMVKLSKARAQ